MAALGGHREATGFLERLEGIDEAAGQIHR